ncbi:hypothetical protein MJO29_015311 [Puccinia striiformis f. sp. tritici]|nr:hypothetical protein MJO29_015311 [Puccinia striiformis f. sp. tritici]
MVKGENDDPFEKILDILSMDKATRIKRSQKVMRNSAGKGDCSIGEVDQTHTNTGMPAGEALGDRAGLVRVWVM